MNYLLKHSVRSFTMVSLIFSAVQSADMKIFDGSPKIIIRTECSIKAERTEWRTARYGGGSSVIRWFAYGGDHTGLDTVNGEYVLSRNNPWISQVGAQIAAARSNCPGCPVIFIAQSGSGFADNEMVVDNVCDSVQIDAVVERIKVMCDKVKEAGADIVMWATYPFNHRHRRFGEMEPHIVQAFNKKYPQYIGIDVVTPVLNAWPIANALDMTHLCGYGKEMQGHEWFKAMLKHDGITEVPKWSSDSVESAGVSERRLREEMAKSWKFPPNGSRFALGDEIVVEFNPTADYLTLLGGDCKTQIELKHRRIDKEPSETFGSKARVYWDVSSKSWSGKRVQFDICTPRTFRMPVNQEPFKIIGDNSLQYPVPVFLGAGVSGVNKAHWVGTYAAYDNIDSMIVIYPFDNVDRSKAIYPMNYGWDLPDWPMECTPSPAARRPERTAPEHNPITIKENVVDIRCGRNTRVIVVNATGKLIREGSYTGVKDASVSLPAGNVVYFTSVHSDGKAYHRKLFVVK